MTGAMVEALAPFMCPDAAPLKDVDRKWVRDALVAALRAGEGE
jgi:hypothetical protein